LSGEPWAANLRSLDNLKTRQSDLDSSPLPPKGSENAFSIVEPTYINSELAPAWGRSGRPSGAAKSHRPVFEPHGSRLYRFDVDGAHARLAPDRLASARLDLGEAEGSRVFHQATDLRRPSRLWWGRIAWLANSLQDPSDDDERSRQRVDELAFANVAGKPQLRLLEGGRTDSARSSCKLPEEDDFPQLPVQEVPDQAFEVQNLRQFRRGRMLGKSCRKELAHLQMDQWIMSVIWNVRSARPITTPSKSRGFAPAVSDRCGFAMTSLPLEAIWNGPP
jgi:hypothetical protein